MCLSCSGLQDITNLYNPDPESCTYIFKQTTGSKIKKTNSNIFLTFTVTKFINQLKNPEDALKLSNQSLDSATSWAKLSLKDKL